MIFKIAYLFLKFTRRKPFVNERLSPRFFPKNFNAIFYIKRRRSANDISSKSDGRKRRVSGKTDRRSFEKRANRKFRQKTGIEFSRSYNKTLRFLGNNAEKSLFYTKCFPRSNLKNK
jgi:hypothetical protein